MKHINALVAILLALGVGVLGMHYAGIRVTAQSSPAAIDWPQWRGPNRDGMSRETGLVTTWPRTGPPAVWSAADLGAGFGSVSVLGDRVFVQGARNRQSVVFSLNRTTARWCGAARSDRPVRTIAARVRVARRRPTAIASML